MNIRATISNIASTCAKAYISGSMLFIAYNHYIAEQQPSPLLQKVQRIVDKTMQGTFLSGVGITLVGRMIKKIWTEERDKYPLRRIAMDAFVCASTIIYASACIAAAETGKQSICPQSDLLVLCRC